LLDNPSYNATAYIDVLPNTHYTVSTFYHGAIYDGDKNYISAIPGKTFETPANGYFIRLSVAHAVMDTMQIEHGDQMTSYTPFVEYIPKDFTEKHDIQGEDLEDDSIPPEKTTFVSRSKNLFNKETIADGYLLNQVHGAIQENKNHWLSDFIDVKE